MISKNINYYILIPVSAIGLYIYSVWCGVGYTFDSHLYEQIAIDFRQDSWAGLNNEWLGNKPPLLSLILALIGNEYVVIFNLVCFALVIGMSFQLCDLYLQNRWIKLIGMMVICFGLPIYLVNNFLWSEPFFNVLVLIIFSLLGVNKIKVVHWVILVLLANLMILMRHAGVFVLLGLFISRYVLYQDKNKVITHLGGLLICCFGSIAWFLIAPSSGSDWAAAISADNLIYKIGHNFYMLAHALTLWFLPLTVPFVMRLILIVTAIILLFWRFKLALLMTQVDWFWLLASGIYIGCLHEVYEMPIEDGERYFSPIFPILLLILFKLLDKKIYLINTNKWRVTVLTMVALWSFYPIIRTINNVVFWHNLRCEEKVKSSKDFTEVLNFTN